MNQKTIYIYIYIYINVCGRRGRQCRFRKHWRTRTGIYSVRVYDVLNGFDCIHFAGTQSAYLYDERKKKSRYSWAIEFRGYNIIRKLKRRFFFTTRSFYNAMNTHAHTCARVCIIISYTTTGTRYTAAN